MRQTVANITKKLLGNTLAFKLEFHVAQTKSTRVHHLDNRSQTALLQSELSKLVMAADASSRLLAVCDPALFRTRLTSIEQSFKLNKNSQFSFLLK